MSYFLLTELVDAYVAGTVVIEEDDECICEEYKLPKVTCEEIDEAMIRHETGATVPPQCESGDSIEATSEESEATSSEASSKVSPKPSPDKNPERVDWDKAVEAVNFWKDIKEHPWKKSKTHLKFETVKKNFSFVTNENQLYKWAKVVERGETPLYWKFTLLVNDVRERYEEARNKFLTVHDRDIKRWGLVYAKKHHIDNFKASDHWVNDFKKTCRISNRRVTKFVSKVSVENLEDIVVRAEKFVEDVRKLIKEYGPENVYNMDQSGFERSMMSHTTLASTGSSQVQVLTQSVSGTTHTYTIQPIVSASGRFVLPLTICLQEKDGKFGDRVKEGMYKNTDLIYSIASQSGKMGTSQLKDWFVNVMLKQCGNKFVLVVDSYTAHKAFRELIPKDANIRIVTIPAGATGMIQPLDVYGFRYWKQFARFLTSEVIMSKPEVQMYTRDSIIKLQAVLAYQFSSEKLTNFWKYSWVKSGYINAVVADRKSPKDVCTANMEEKCSECSEVNCIVCCFCEKAFCVQHLFNSRSLHVKCQL